MGRRLMLISAKQQAECDQHTEDVEFLSLTCMHKIF